MLSLYLTSNLSLVLLPHHHSHSNISSGQLSHLIYNYLKYSQREGLPTSVLRGLALLTCYVLSKDAGS